MLKYQKLSAYLLSQKDLNPYQKDYFVKQFNDSYYFDSEKYKDQENFAYVRNNAEDNKTSAVIENILHFFMRYPNFYERTGISFQDFLMMDPSTSDLIKHTWAELVKPEEKQSEQINQLQNQLKSLTQKINGGR